MSKINKKPGVTYPVLIPNLQGLERALQAGTTEIAVFCAATETFSQKNTHCSIAESLDKIAAVVLKAKANLIPIRAYISCALGCPYEGLVKPTTVLAMAKQLMTLGCDEIALGDTIGIGTPLQAQNLIKMIAAEIPIHKLAIHFHDTYGQALANIYACLEVGIMTIDSAIGGLGGCPYAAGASGNVATEDVLYMLQGLGIATGVNLDAIIATSQFINQLTNHAPRSKVTQAKIGKTNGRIP